MDNTDLNNTCILTHGVFGWYTGASFNGGVKGSMKVLITGGAGFIGSNLADYYLKQGYEVIIFDNLSRGGTQQNLELLINAHRDSGRLRFVKGDIRNMDDVLDVVEDDIGLVFHCASQVAVTTSVEDPYTDFEVNAAGTIHLLEAIRHVGINPIFFFTSTNKVYGGMEDVETVENDSRYAFRDFPEGISEERPLDFHSPYGCSKGAADQYVHDYARIYDFNTVVFRMSCQYGIRQFGNEDQGWVAHFVISALQGKPLRIFGNGKQVRDILYIDDLIRAFELARKNIRYTRGNIYNIGGGHRFALSLRELIALLEEQLDIR